jgi:hypothetical protein
MKNFITLIAIAAIIGFSILKGLSVPQQSSVQQRQTTAPTDVPWIGRIQVLNGCGSGGSARIIADHLRRSHFDVKNIGNAENWNFPQTLVISRVNDTTIAAQVAEALKTDNMVLIRTQENLYDVTVIVGPDYRERIQ